MKVLAVNGSPRRERSNTRRLLDPLLEGAESAGAEVERVYLTDLDVRPCKGCMSCWVATPGRCVQQDDMAALLEKMRSAQAIVIGFPLYIFGVPARVQAMLERLLPTVEPWLVREGGRTTHPTRDAVWKAHWLAIANCGFPEQVHFDAVERKFAYLGVPLLAMSAGEFLRTMEREPALAGPLEALRSALRQAGESLARQGRVPEELLSRLRRPIIEYAGITPDQYAEGGNESFHRALRIAERKR